MTPFSPTQRPVVQDVLASPGFRRYFTNTSWMMGEKAIRMGVNFLVGIFIARRLGPAGYGLLSYGLSVVALFGILSSLGLDEIIVRNLVRDPLRKDGTLGTGLGLRIAGAVLVLVLAPSFSFLVAPDRESLLVVLILAFGPFFQSFALIDFFFQSQVQARDSSIALGGAFALASLFKVALLLANAHVLWFAAAYLSENVAMAAAFAVMYKRRGNRISRWEFHRKEALALLRDAAPMIFSGFLAMVYSRIDQVMIKSMLGSDAVGNYSVAVAMTEAWQVVPFVLTASLFPAIIGAKRDHERVFHGRMYQLYGFLLWASVALALPVCLASGWIIGILFGAAYKPSGPALSILIWNCVFIFLHYANAKWIVTENMQRIWLLISPAGCLINVTGNLLLIGRYGIAGAAVATLITQFVTSHLAFAFSRKTFPLFATHWKALLMPLILVRDFRSKAGKSM
ncbi:MAG TPA: flippase [Syntrophales bacterium]|nr:flippase [Syntrophales bacterium]HQN77900.1 flippase [Syntrophales bacterium]HQQ27584.1 flippase [Syntrophales bacterium]